MLGNLIAILAALFVVVWRDSLSVGLSGLIIATSLGISNTLNWLMKCISNFEANITSIERIKEYCELDQEPQWTVGDKDKPSPDWPEKGHIKLENYSLKYRDDLDHALKNLNFEVKPCEKIGIVGNYTKNT